MYVETNMMNQRRFYDERADNAVEMREMPKREKASEKISERVPDFENTEQESPAVKKEHESCYVYDKKGKRSKSQNEMKKLGCKHRLPGALVIGVKKCGTGAMQYFLELHPDVETKGGPIYVMERPDMEKSLQNWKSAMPVTRPDQLMVADYPELIDYPNFVAHILKDYDPSGQMKLIMIIRDPIKRAISDYVHVQDFSSRKKATVSCILSYRTPSERRGEKNKIVQRI